MGVMGYGEKLSLVVDTLHTLFQHTFSMGAAIQTLHTLNAHNNILLFSTHFCVFYRFSL